MDGRDSVERSKSLITDTITVQDQLPALIRVIKPDFISCFTTLAGDERLTIFLRSACLCLLITFIV